MPITTPDHIISTYGSDSQHFKHVLDHLFIPAIKLAGLEVVQPSAKGAELIHGEIIKNLESSDLVLCDMSLLNPNVFFELGIRTALNKPVCMVKDQKTERVPFDTTIINHHTYNSTLAPWMLDEEIQSLKAHIEASMSSHANNNALWSYFSMSLKAQPPKETTGVEGKFDFLNLQLEGLRRQLDILNTGLPIQKEKRRSAADDTIFNGLLEILGEYDSKLNKIDINDFLFILEFNELIPPNITRLMKDYAEINGYKIKFTFKPKEKA